MKQLVINFGIGRAVPFFKTVDVTDEKVTGEWIIVTLDKAQPVGSYVKEFSRNDIATKFSATYLELETLHDTLEKMLLDPSVGRALTMTSADGETETKLVFPANEPMSIMILKSAIAQTITAVDMIQQTRKVNDILKKELDDSKHELNKLRNENEYAKLKDDGEPYDQAISDLVRFRQIFPPDIFDWDELEMISQASAKAMALACMAHLMGED